MTMATRKHPLLGACATVLALSIGSAFAAELPPGTVISAENIDKAQERHLRRPHHRQSADGKDGMAHPQQRLEAAAGQVPRRSSSTPSG
jgi:hypothetical protein